MDLYIEIIKSFTRISKFLTREQLLELKRTPANALEKYNFGFGTMIRMYILRPESRLYAMFIRHGYNDKDEMTMEIIRRFHGFIPYVI